MKTSWVTSIILLMVCAASFSQCEAAGPSTAPVELNAPIGQLKIKAIMGDAISAAKLSDYYKFEKNMDPKWKYWTLIAAENGYPRSQFDEYVILSLSTDTLLQRRAFYWLKKSAKNGFSGAQLELERCFPSGSFEKRNLDCFGKNAR